MQRFVFYTLSALSLGATLFAGCTQDFSIFQVNGADTTATGGASSASTSVTTGGGAPGTSTSSGGGCTSDASCDDQNPCTADHCDGQACVNASQDGQAPSDENDCTIEVCKGGVLTTGFAEKGTICGIGLTCDGMGKCGGCVSDLQCMVSGECKVAYCVNSTCVVQAAKVGTPCTQGICSMAGTCVECLNDMQCLPGDGCSKGACVDACMDGHLDKGESDVDCGGPLCDRCPEGKKCKSDDECASDACMGGICVAAPTCMDKMLNGAETDVDCGGLACPKCDKDQKCERNEDCLTDRCKHSPGPGPNRCE